MFSLRLGITTCTIIWFKVVLNRSSPSHALFMNLTEKQARCTVLVFLGLSGLVQCWGATNLVSGRSETLLNMKGITGVKQQRGRDLRKWWDQQIFPFPTVARCNLVKLARGYVRSLHGPCQQIVSIPIFVRLFNISSLIRAYVRHLDLVQWNALIIFPSAIHV